MLLPTTPHHLAQQRQLRTAKRTAWRSCRRRCRAPPPQLVRNNGLEAELGVEVGKARRLLLAQLGGGLARVLLGEHLAHGPAHLLVREGLLGLDRVLDDLLQGPLLLVLEVTLESREERENERGKERGEQKKVSHMCSILTLR